MQNRGMLCRMGEVLLRKELEFDPCVTSSGGRALEIRCFTDKGEGRSVETVRPFHCTKPAGPLQESRIHAG